MPFVNTTEGGMSAATTTPAKQPRRLKFPDLAAVHQHIGYLRRELRIARRLLRLALEARDNNATSTVSDRAGVARG